MRVVAFLSRDPVLAQSLREKLRLRRLHVCVFAESADLLRAPRPTLLLVDGLGVPNPDAAALRWLELEHVPVIGLGTQMPAAWRQRALHCLPRGVSEALLHSVLVAVTLLHQRSSRHDRLRALGQMAAGVAHDFNNMIMAIGGRIQLARLKLQRGLPVEEDLNVMETASRNAAAIAARLHDFITGRHSKIWHEVDLQKLAHDAAALCRAQLPAGVELVVQTRGTPTVRGHEHELREVLLNLLNNAKDAVGKQGLVRLCCGTHNGCASLTVEDNGPGIPKAVKDRLFEPFFSTKPSGTGLGLNISRWILRQHRAKLQLEALQPRGSRFRIIFPIAKSPPHQAASTQTPTAPALRHTSHLAK